MNIPSEMDDLARSNTMKHLILITAAIIGLSGAAIAGTKKSGHHSYGYQPDERGIEAPSSQVDVETEIKLRRMGLSADHAHWGAWAIRNRPYSSCGEELTDLMMVYDKGRLTHKLVKVQKVVEGMVRLMERDSPCTREEVGAPDPSQ